MASDEIFRKLRVFVACPGDVEDEKERLEKLIRTLQFDASNHGFILELVEWRQCVPDLGLPQSVIFQQLKPESWDIFHWYSLDPVRYSKRIKGRSPRTYRNRIR